MPFQASISDVQTWIATYGLWIVFISLTLENILFISMIIPGLLVLVVSGFLSASGNFSIAWVLLTGILGVWIGDTTNYFIGRHLWGPLLGRNRRASSILNRFRPALEHRGSLIFVIYHFEPFVRMIGAAAVGTIGVPIKRWIPYDYAGAVLWVSFYGIAGYILGKLSRDINDWHSVQPVQVVALLVVLVWILLVGRTVRRVMTETESKQES